MNIYGTALSRPCIFTENEIGGTIRGCPRFLALVSGNSNLRLLDSSSGRSGPIALHRIDRSGKARFRWL